MLAVLKQREWIDLRDHLVGHLAGRMQAHAASNIPRYNIKKQSIKKSSNHFLPTNSNERTTKGGGPNRFHLPSLALVIALIDDCDFDSTAAHREIRGVHEFTDQQVYS
jgi:hypothetical protein